MKQAKKKQVTLLNKLCDMVRGSLGKLDRKRVVAIITVEVHSRDTITRMISAQCASINDFEWLLQLRFYWEEGQTQRCIVKQTNTQTLYGYEYLGNPGRLVVTPLTDRCYTTLTTALHLIVAASPQAPPVPARRRRSRTSQRTSPSSVSSSTALMVWTTSRSAACSRASRRRARGRASTSSTASRRVLSVVAQQILSSSLPSRRQDALRLRGREIKLDPTCGIFVTMNPGYAGRSELPENLKALLRPMSMMKPDMAMIMELCSLRRASRRPRSWRRRCRRSTLWSSSSPSRTTRLRPPLGQIRPQLGRCSQAWR